MNLRALLRKPSPKPEAAKAPSVATFPSAAYAAHWVPRALGAAKNWRSISIVAAGFDLVQASGTLAIPFAKVRDTRLKKGWLFGTVTLDLDDGSSIALDGFRFSEAQDFHGVACDAIGAATAIGHLQSHHDSIRRLDVMVAELKAASRFVAHSEVERIADEIAPHLLPLQTCNRSEVESPFSEIASRLITFLADRQTTRDANNEQFLAMEASACAQLFDTLERMPLTATQRRAALVDEDNTLVLAGAGSGKTSLITAKVAHLMHRGLARESDILLLAFSRDSRGELEDRIRERVKRQIKASTFHALGLEIVGACEERKPSVSVLATDEVKLRKFINDQLEKLFLEPSSAAKGALRWFSEYFSPQPNAFEFKTLGEYYDYIRNFDIRSLKGDRVKSYEECLIANFLYLNGIEYEYEAQYEHDTATARRRQYRPDFKIGDAGLYVEHFAVDRSGRTPPFIDQVRYTEEIEWKRDQHSRRGTRLIETFSWQASEASLLEELERSLKHHGVKFQPIAGADILARLRELGRVDRVTGLLVTFLRLSRSAGLDMAALRTKVYSTSAPRRAQAFLDMFEPISRAYEEELARRGEIDFEQMILKAEHYVASGRFRSPWRWIIVDEFQDISVGRARLLKALLDQRADRRFYAVGDDWQAIFRFAGGDISVMRNFRQHFGYTKRVELDRTFRFSQTLGDVAGTFVLRNPSQLDKKVRSDKAPSHPTITVVSRSDEAPDPLTFALSAIGRRCDGRKASVLLLGRYRHNEPGNLAAIANRFPSLEISFLTVHRSKGLEADFVVVLDVSGGRYGFPSEIADDPVLNLVISEPEGYPNAEERRLFYVALTRAREAVYITVDGRPSAFVQELLGGSTQIAHQGVTASERCPVCRGGVLRERAGRFGPFRGCSNHPYCDYTQPATHKARPNVSTSSGSPAN